MKIAVSIFYLFVFQFVVKADNISLCRKNIDHVIKMTSGAQTLNTQCTDAVVKDLLAKKEYEVNELLAYQKNLDTEIKKRAVSVNSIIINCGVETLNKMEDVVKCRALKAERAVLLNRIDRLNNWEIEFKKALSDPKTAFEKVGDPPCASTAEFEALVGVKKFNIDLYKKWEECVYK